MDAKKANVLEFRDILRYQTEHRRRDVMVNNLKRKGRERYIIKSPSCMVGCMGSGKRLLLKRGVGVSSKHQLVNLYLLRVRPGWCAKGQKVYSG